MKRKKQRRLEGVNGTPAPRQMLRSQREFAPV
jgi:hypothetical protein